jgi:hypothetical protein
MGDGTREDTTVSVQFEEIKHAIRAFPFVTKLSPVRVHKGHGDGWGVSLRCSTYEEYDNCEKKQDPPVQVSSVHPTELACFQELLKRLQDRHVECVQTVAKKAVADVSSATVSPDTPKVLLRDHRQQTTRVQNHHNVQVGSRKNQAKTRTSTDGFLHHTRLGLVGWISYWCWGDSALTVDMLINTFGLTELVSDSLPSRK